MGLANRADCCRVSDNERKTLLVAGAAAGMTTVFGTPIAAIMLAVELLDSFEWTPRSFIPVAVAAIIAERRTHHAAHCRGRSFRSRAPWRFPSSAFAAGSWSVSVPVCCQDC
ncbi:chloride channel protein [Mesorhizobium calcicola]|uniref:Chloride channel protein n=1 Tax=Mesorhizobium calcicola TaxID=1300310 RepID=A0ABW4WQ17_9HYPH